MTGQVTGHAGGRSGWASELVEIIASHPAPIVVDDPGTEHGRALVRALGATIAGDPEPDSEPVKTGT